MAATTSGMVMNGPTPIMSIILRLVALHRPMPRMRVGEALTDSCAGCIFGRDVVDNVFVPRSETQPLRLYGFTANGGPLRWRTSVAQRLTASRAPRSTNSHIAARLLAHPRAAAGRMRSL